MVQVPGLLWLVAKDIIVATQCLAPQHLSHSPARRPALKLLASLSCCGRQFEQASNECMQKCMQSKASAIPPAQQAGVSMHAPVCMPAIAPGISRLEPAMPLIHLCSFPLYLQSMRSSRISEYFVRAWIAISEPFQGSVCLCRCRCDGISARWSISGLILRKINLFKPVCEVHGNEVLELGVCQRDVRPSCHIRPRTDAVGPRPIRQRPVQGCAIHDTVAECAQLCTLHR